MTVKTIVSAKYAVLQCCSAAVLQCLLRDANFFKPAFPSLFLRLFLLFLGTLLGSN